MSFNREIIKVSHEDPVLSVFHWNILSDQLSGFFPSVDDKYVAVDKLSIGKYADCTDTLSAPLYVEGNANIQGDCPTTWG